MVDYKILCWYAVLVISTPIIIFYNSSIPISDLMCMITILWESMIVVTVFSILGTRGNDLLVLKATCKHLLYYALSIRRTINLPSIGWNSNRGWGSGKILYVGKDTHYSRKFKNSIATQNIATLAYHRPRNTLKHSNNKSILRETK